jgi:hypothetical protein
MKKTARSGQATRFPHHGIGIVLAIATALAVIYLHVSSVMAQTNTASPSAQPPTSRPPLARLYWHFLAYQNFLDRTAANLDQHGGNGDELRNRFQRKVGFTSAQFGTVRQAAVKLESDLKPKDAQAKVIIDAFHAKYPPGKVTTLPPPPPELAQLQQEREQLIEQDVSDLKSQLGPEASAKMDAFLQNDFAPTVKYRQIQIPRPAPFIPATSLPNEGNVFKAVQP